MNPYKKSNIILGCMRLNRLDEQQADTYINQVFEKGVNYFDHADIYGNGECETIFGKVLKNNKKLRDKIIIQDKCSIVPGKMYDCSYEHIIESVEGSLKRLKTDYLDVLLIHRPDALFEPEEINKAFNKLLKDGKVKNFGVSNFNYLQLSLLRKSLDTKLLFNQLQFGPAHCDMVADAMQANIVAKKGLNRASDTLDYCRLKNIRIQAWSPLQFGLIQGCFLRSKRYEALNAKLAEIGERYQVAPSTIAIAFILRHPAKMQVICGSMNEEHFSEMVAAQDITLSREEWYEIYLAAGYLLP